MELLFGWLKGMWAIGHWEEPKSPETPQLTSLDRLSRNPISFPAIAKQYVHPMSLEIIKEEAEVSQNRRRELEQMRSRFREIGKIAYNENTYRWPVGVGILLALIFLSFYGLIYFLSS